MDSPAASLVVKVTCGTEALERLNQGFTVAATALAAGVEVSLWLTGRGLTVDDLLPGVVIRGAAAFVEEVMSPGARSLVY